MQKITPFLWFDKEAGEAAKFYTSIFKDSKMKESTVLNDTPSGTVEIIAIELFGQNFTLMSAGPLFNFNESISFVVRCQDQEEVDYYWNKLTAGGGQESMCGWLKDKYGLSWQIVPTVLDTMLKDHDKNKVARVTQAFLTMKKFDLKKLQQAYDQQ